MGRRSRHRVYERPVPIELTFATVRHRTKVNQGARLHGRRDRHAIKLIEAAQERWRADGAGRADIVIASGDVPADPGKVSAVECWGSDFTRSYYSDSINFEPNSGDMAACVYDAP